MMTMKRSWATIIFVVVVYKHEINTVSISIIRKKAANLKMSVYIVYIVLDLQEIIRESSWEYVCIISNDVSKQTDAWSYSESRPDSQKSRMVNPESRNLSHNLVCVLAKHFSCTFKKYKDYSKPLNHTVVLSLKLVCYFAENSHRNYDQVSAMVNI